MPVFRSALQKIVCILFLAFVIGCSKTPAPPPPSLSEAHEKFLKLCQEEYDLAIVTQSPNNTIWIYLPLEENLFAFVANDKGPQLSRESSRTPAINFLDGQFEEGTFKIQFDISLSQKYAKSYGYTTGYSKSYSTKQRNILTALSRSYFEVEEDAPDFVVLVIADITRGIETKMVFYFPDLKRAMVDSSFYEEYTRRLVVEDTTGHTDIIDDRTGRHLDFQEITWPIFLTKQILYRIRVKYQRSGFPPSDDTRKELLTIVARVVEAYDFTDFKSVELYDLESKAAYTVELSELEKHKPQEKPSTGKLHTIKFF